MRLKVIYKDRESGRPEGGFGFDLQVRDCALAVFYTIHLHCGHTFVTYILKRKPRRARKFQTTHTRHIHDKD